MANTPELGALIASKLQLRMIGPIYTLKTGFWVRKDCGMQNGLDLRGKRVTMGYSAMRALDPTVARDARDRRPHARTTSSRCWCRT